MANSKKGMNFPSSSHLSGGTKPIGMSAGYGYGRGNGSAGYISSDPYGAAGSYTIGVSDAVSYPNVTAGVPLSSTVFPCGHTVKYQGSPPSHCSWCGTAHQNEIYMQQYVTDARVTSASMSPVICTDIGVQVQEVTRAWNDMKKPKTSLDWLEGEIQVVRDKAYV